MEKTATLKTVRIGKNRDSYIILSNGERVGPFNRVQAKREIRLMETEGWKVYNEKTTGKIVEL